MSILGFNSRRQLSNYRLILQITHVPTGYKVEFPAFLEMISDAYTQQWNSEDVYGRMDPIATFINTRRAVSLAWNVPAQSYYDAQNNLQKVNTLMSFMYPLYQDNGPGGATAINQAPLLRIKFGNLVQTPSGDGLLGYVNGFTFDPDLTNGMFYSEKSKKVRYGTQYSAEYYPKTFRLNTELNVLHEHSLGYKRSVDGRTFTYRDKGLSDSNFPYATGLNPLVGDDHAAQIAATAAKAARLSKEHDQKELNWQLSQNTTSDKDFLDEIEYGLKNPSIDAAAAQSPVWEVKPATEAQADPESVTNTQVAQWATRHMHIDAATAPFSKNDTS